ncbi:hypothetical protein [Archangium primigenium]|uniref:hypothetical protein n=1 Tax=[Archangium] primigenium TaxID=2792470 RepID=UPI00195F06A4|nr:hypothetical protein [Archangium primigenium]MBM7118437.1 hypothetical protein [Archangium primigenium]
MDNFQNDFPGAPAPMNTQAAREAVSGPAILLMVTAGLGLAGAFFSFISSMMGGGTLSPEQLEQLRQTNMENLIPWVERANSFGVVGNLFTLALSGVTFYGALQMKNLRNYGLSMAAAIIAIVPCFGPCCCIGIPAGIWALVVINKPEVKAAFTK